MYILVYKSINFGPVWYYSIKKGFSIRFEQATVFKNHMEIERFFNQNPHFLEFKDEMRILPLEIDVCMS